MKTFKNPISTAMSEYREDFRYNREWWVERMGNGNNNEYLWIQFKNGDNITVQADYFQMDGNTCLPRFRADEVAYISRYFGDQCETTTAADIVVDTDRIILYADGVEYFRYEMSEEEFKEMRCQMWELDDETDSTAWMLDYCRALANSKMNNNGNTLNISDLANWINFQLSTIIEGVSAGYTLGNNNTVWIDKGATVFTVSLATGEEIEINSDNYATAEDIAKAIISTLNNNTPTTSDTMNTETKAMNEEKVTAIYNRVDSMKVRGAWNNGVKAYALMLLEWYKDEASENPLTLETMLNGAKGWGHYSRSGCGVAQCYNARIAETLCSPSELKRVKGGLKNPNRFEDWCDVEGRALFQAWQFIKRAENFVNCNA